MRESAKRSGKIGKVLSTSMLGCTKILGTKSGINGRFGSADPVFSITISFTGVLASSNGVSGTSTCGAIENAIMKRTQARAILWNIWKKNIGVYPGPTFGTLRVRAAIVKREKADLTKQNSAKKKERATQRGTRSV